MLFLKEWHFFWIHFKSSQNIIYLLKPLLMKKITLLALTFLLVACGSGNIEKLISNGNYDAAINKAISKLSKNKDAKGKQDYVYLLQEVYAKANDRDLTQIDRLVKEASASNFEKVYNLY